MTENERRRMPQDTPEWAGDDPVDTWPARPEARGEKPQQPEVDEAEVDEAQADEAPDEPTEDPLELPAEPELPPATDDELAHEGEPQDAAELEEREHAEHAAGEIDVPDGYTLIEGYPAGHRRTVAIVVARFNGEITNRMLASALEELEVHGVPRASVTVMPVPGAFELALGAMALAKTRRFSCIVTLGCVIRGETPHFDYVASEAASGVQLAGIETGVPVAFGVLTVEDVAQAEARIDKGAEAVRTALEMADVFGQVRAQAGA
jgi:6,7-dimethyl-8-ribityllumazine synthase